MRFKHPQYLLVSSVVYPIITYPISKEIERFMSQEDDLYESSQEEDEFCHFQKNPEIVKLIKLLEQFSLKNNVGHYFIGLKKKERERILREMRTTLNSKKFTEKKPALLKIFSETSHIPDEIKSEVISRYLESSTSYKSEKTQDWIQTVLNIPYGKYSPEINASTLQNSKRILDEAIYGHDIAKYRITSYIAQLLRNQNSAGLILGLKSYPGIGKTSLIERGVSRLLNRPFFNVSLGGVHDSSFLRGFQFTYEGSEPGFIVKSLISGGVMNPIIFFDELDKVSTTSKGDEIINTLMQLTDPIQSKYFQDRYLGGTVPLDLSRCIIIFAYNSRENINRILLDRISEVELSGFSTAEKLVVARDHLIPSILKDIGLPDKDIAITEGAIMKIITDYTNEAGVRHLKQVLYEVFRDINTKMLLSSPERDDEGARPAKRGRRTRTPIIASNDRGSARTLTDSRISESLINEDNLQTFITTYKEEVKTTVKDRGAIGRVNGLYVTSHGNSGIIPIEVNWFPSEHSFGILFTGNLGKVMGESVHVAKSVAWLNIPERIKKTWVEEWKVKRTSIHVHCSDSATPKEGPSAGMALSLAIWSLLMKKVIPPQIAMTGEMNLSGEITAIGGVKEKLEGAKKAKCQIVLLPAENAKDLVSDEMQQGSDNLKIIQVSNFSEVLEIVNNL